MINTELPTNIPQGLEDGTIRNLMALTGPDFDIEAIAARLAKINRFGGATKWPYSVATHSVLVSALCPKQYRWPGLLHDITESFGINDMISPVKRAMPHYKLLEAAIRAQLLAPFGLELDEPEAVKTADERAYQLECYYLRGAWPRTEHTRFAVAEVSLREWVLAERFLTTEIPWQNSARMFLAAYNDMCDTDF